MDLELTGKTVLITGGTDGLGLALATKLASEGAAVAVCGRDEERLLAAEAAVNRATEQLAARRTTLVVAHRLTTASKADRIIALADGQIAEVGTHDELLESGGAYAAMWAAFTGEAELVA